MKKITAFFLTISLCVLLAACNKPVASAPMADTSVPAMDNTAIMPTEFNKSGVLAETVMYDENNIRITANGLTYTNSSAELELTIENNSSTNLTFVSGSVGYACNSINGFMVSAGYLNCDVYAGKAAKDSIRFSYDELMLYGIAEIADMKIGFDIIDDDYNHIYSGPRQVKTTLAESHDYTMDYYRNSITSKNTMGIYGYTIPYFEEKKLFEQDGVHIVSGCIIENSDKEDILLLEAVNNTPNLLYLSASSISFNGLIAYSGTWTSGSIDTGCTRIMEIDLSSVASNALRNTYGINELNAIGLYLTVKDADGEALTDATSLSMHISEKAPTYDNAGTELYNADGLRIISKGVIADESDYSHDMHIYLLAENNSDGDIAITDVYDSLSINDMMCNYYFYSVKLEKGYGAILDIEIPESDLANNDISEVADILKADIGFEIITQTSKTTEITLQMNFQ